MSDKNKFSILLTLIISFLGYSFHLYRPGLRIQADTNNMADKGKKLWQQKNCGSCHQIYGLGGYLGPDLTNIYSSRTEQQIKAFIKSGTNIMPGFDLSDEQSKQLIAYLKSIDATGIAAPHGFNINYDGTIER